MFQDRHIKIPSYKNKRIEFKNYQNRKKRSRGFEKILKKIIHHKKGDFIW